VEPQPETQRTVRFGLFEADLRAGELRKQGRMMKLQEQPFQVLAILLRRPGEVVTREELQQAVWPADTFVEFDPGPQHGGQEDPAGAWGFRRQPAIRGNDPAQRLPVHRAGERGRSGGVRAGGAGTSQTPSLSPNSGGFCARCGGSCGLVLLGWQGSGTGAGTHSFDHLSGPGVVAEFLARREPGGIRVGGRWHV